MAKGSGTQPVNKASKGTKITTSGGAVRKAGKDTRVHGKGMPKC